MFSIFPILLAANFMLISDRASFWDPDKESSKTEEIDEKSSTESDVDFHQFKGKKVILLVHGFNNTAEDAISTYHQIHDRIGNLSDSLGNPIYDVVIGYLWPGCDSRFEYFTAEKNADELLSRMRLHLNALSFFSDKFDVLAHSMGNRVVLGALDYLSNQKKLVQNFYSLAPAVKDESIEKNQIYYNSTQQCQNMYVFHSDNDDVLKFLFLIAERSEALGYEGKGDLSLTSKNIQFIDCSAFVQGHSEYFHADPLYKFIQNQHGKLTLSSDIAPNVKLLADGLIAPLME